jgi:hypothetical protein
LTVLLIVDGHEESVAGLASDDLLDLVNREVVRAGGVLERDGGPVEPEIPPGVASVRRRPRSVDFAGMGVLRNWV